MNAPNGLKTITADNCNTASVLSPNIRVQPFLCDAFDGKHRGKQNRALEQISLQTRIENTKRDDAGFHSLMDGIDGDTSSQTHSQNHYRQVFDFGNFLGGAEIPTRGELAIL